VEGPWQRLFFGEWVWIEGRRTGLHSIASSHNQHIVIAPVAAYQLLLSATGLAHYWVYRLLAVIGHIAVSTAVLAYARRRLGTAALFPAAIVLFLGSGLGVRVAGRQLRLHNIARARYRGHDRNRSG
jgi:hypothetical protein